MIKNSIQPIDLTKLSKLKYAKEVTDFSNLNYYKELLNQMEEICLMERAYGCAAPHFGIQERILLLFLKNENNDVKAVSYFNPVILSQYGEQSGFEGTIGISDCIGNVIRPYQVHFRAQDIHGDSIEKELYGFEAGVFCHEYDLLNGIRFTDRANNIFYLMNESTKKEMMENNPPIVFSTIGEYQDHYEKKKRYRPKQITDSF